VERDPDAVLADAGSGAEPALDPEEPGDERPL